MEVEVEGKIRVCYYIFTFSLFPYTCLPCEHLSDLQNMYIYIFFIRGIYGIKAGNSSSILLQ